jgi:competence protein ComEA
VCKDCHGPESVLAHQKTRDEWNKTLDEMAANGAQGSDQEWTDILEYLAKHFSPIAVNKATATELAATLDVPAAVAEAIVRARTEKGRLASIDDLKQAAGGEAAAKIDTRKDRLVF